MSNISSVEELVNPDVPEGITRRVLGDEFVSGHIDVARIWNGAEPPLQTIVVPVFNQEPFIQKCLSGIADNISVPSDLIVILDCCTDGSESAVFSFVEQARQRFRRIVILRTTYPIFETQADNLGFLLSRGDHVIEVQSDIEVLTPGFDALLKAPMTISPKIFSTSGRGGAWFAHLLPRSQCRARFPIRAKLWRTFGWDRVGYTGMSIVKAKDHAWSKGSYAQAETVMRGPWCLRRSDLVALGLLDERNYFLGNDDHDLHARAITKGLHCAYVPMRFDSPLAVGSTRQERGGQNLEAYKRLNGRPRNGFLETFLKIYRPMLPCRYVRRA